MKTYYVFNKRTYKPPKGLPLWALNGAIVYVGRPTVFGNPYIVGKDGKQGECVKLYRKWIRLPQQEALRERMRSELKDKHLLCWCSPLPCHADVIMEIVNPQQKG